MWEQISQLTMMANTVEAVKKIIKLQKETARKLGLKKKEEKKQDSNTKGEDRLQRNGWNRSGKSCQVLKDNDRKKAERHL